MVFFMIIGCYAFLYRLYKHTGYQWMNCTHFKPCNAGIVQYV